MSQRPDSEATGIKEEIVVTGVALSFGMATGRAYFYKTPTDSVENPKNQASIEEEKKRMKDSISRLRDNISELLSETAIILTEESLEIFDVYRLLVQDVVFEKELMTIIESGKTAYEATEIMTQNFRRKMRSDSFWQTRLYDMQY